MARFFRAGVAAALLTTSTALTSDDGAQSADRLSLLARESAALAEINAFLDGRDPTATIETLTSALESDPRFQTGADARNVAVRALARVRVASGDERAVLSDQQTTALIRASSEPELTLHSRTSAIHALAAAPADMNDTVFESLLDSLSENRSEIVIAALQTARIRGKAPPSWRRPLREIIADPARFNADAFATNRPGRNPEDWMTIQGDDIKRARAAAAAVFGITAEPRETIDLVEAADPAHTEALMEALLAPIILDESPFWRSREETTSRWLETLLEMAKRPEGSATARCCTMIPLARVMQRSGSADVRAQARRVARGIADHYPEFPELSEFISRTEGR